MSGDPRDHLTDEQRAYVASVVARAPTLTPAGVDRMRRIWRPGGQDNRKAS